MRRRRSTTTRWSCFATSCVWNGDRLTIYEPSQYVHGLKNGVAEQLGIDADKVRVINSYVGGAFGSKGSMTPRTAIIASIARRLSRPVKLVATRDQGFNIATYRAETRHQIQIGASRDGKLTALRHEGWEISSRADAYAVGGTKTTTRLYACPNVDSLVSIVRADRNTPGFMRSPPEVPYMFALESAHGRTGRPTRTWTRSNCAASTIPPRSRSVASPILRAR